jgi:hypothetical protein
LRQEASLKTAGQDEGRKRPSEQVEKMGKKRKLALT